MSKQYLPIQPSKKICYLLIVLVLGLYFLENSPVLSLTGSKLYFNYIKPGIWIGFAFIILFSPDVRFKGKIKHINFFCWWAFNFAIIFIIISVLAGVFIDGLGKSPYNHSITGILLNILLVGSILLGTELIRNYLVNSFIKKENYFIFILIAIFFTFISMSWNKFETLKSLEDIVKFGAQFIAPEFSKNLFAVYLAFWGGPIPSIIYMGVLQAFKWFSPALPNLQWITAAFVGVLCPVFSLSILQGMYAKESKVLKNKDKDEESPLSWILTSIGSIAIIWFVVGVFPVYPSAIATGSMKPVIEPGDVILVNKVKSMDDIEKLNTGDVIQFRRNSILISHRIIEKVEVRGDKTIRYRTKGDNNSAPDNNLVKPEQIKGKVIKVLPKIGWPTLLIKGKKNINDVDNLEDI